MARIALLCSEPIRESMAGIGIRYLEFARRLPTLGIDTVLVSPGPVRQAQDLGLPVERLRRYERGGLARILCDCDGIVAQGHLANEALRTASSKPIAIDLCDPFLIENLVYSRDGKSELFARDRLSWLLQMSRGDFLLCSSEEQRTFYLGFLASLGRINPDSVRRDPELAHLLAVVPFGLPDELPVHRPYLPTAAKGKKRFLFGGLYDWYDPWTVLKAFEILDRPDWSILFVRNPNPETTPQTLIGRVARWAGEHGWLGNRVEIIDWVPAERRFDLLRDVDALVATHSATIEAQISIRTRFLEAMLAGCPIVASEGGTIARIVAARTAGFTVPTGDSPALARLLAGMFNDPTALNRRLEAGRALAAEFVWQRAIAPLLPFCRSPWIDPGKPALPQAMGESSGLASPGSRSVTSRILGRVRRIRRPRGMA